MKLMRVLNAKVAHLYLNNLRRRSFEEGATSSPCNIQTVENRPYFKLEILQIVLAFRSCAICKNLNYYKHE